MITFKDANGETRYWKTQAGAWNYAAKLNAKLEHGMGMWYFEGEHDKGWFLEYHPD
jgi:hypothetical protein